MKNYLLNLELNKIGYIIGFTKNIKKARRIKDNMIEASLIYSIHEIEKYHSHLSEFQSYIINGNCTWVGKFHEQITNGALTFSIIEINPKTFILEQFIRERENCSSVFDYHDPKWEKLVEENDNFMDMLAN